MSETTNKNIIKLNDETYEAYENIKSLLKEVSEELEELTDDNVVGFLIASFLEGLNLEDEGGEKTDEDKTNKIIEDLK